MAKKSPEFREIASQSYLVMGPNMHQVTIYSLHLLPMEVRSISVGPHLSIVHMRHVDGHDHVANLVLCLLLGLIYQQPPMQKNGTPGPHQFGTPFLKGPGNDVRYCRTSHIPVRCSFGVRWRSKLIMMVEIVQITCLRNGKSWQNLGRETWKSHVS